MVIELDDKLIIRNADKKIKKEMKRTVLFGWVILVFTLTPIVPLFLLGYWFPAAGLSFVAWFYYFFIFPRQLGVKYW